MTGTLIAAELDFDAVGEKTGHLRVPHSGDGSACGRTPVFVALIRHVGGGSHTVTGGNHGDDCEDQIEIPAAAEVQAPLANGSVCAHAGAAHDTG